ncbi:hypothetical protein BDA99DRAFT_567485 [Phascolomyces articulosus]|uniref:Uncharacterized protein n=1 Tax=Phascolomyces articulosus TaxID=60185 RepID=A0AAD5PMU8_9FUNG|nr:hypothetical protein BDA99DRAFT_567485 [Phascolomyces articulosus]
MDNRMLLKYFLQSADYIIIFFAIEKNYIQNLMQQQCNSDCPINNIVEHAKLSSLILCKLYIIIIEVDIKRLSACLYLFQGYALLLVPVLYTSMITCLYQFYVSHGIYN